MDSEMVCQRLCRIALFAGFFIIVYRRCICMVDILVSVYC